MTYSDRGELILEADLELYALWQAEALSPQSQSLSFDLQGGEGEVSPILLKGSGTIALPFTGFSREGYSFVGWAEEAGAEAALYPIGEDYCFEGKTEAKKLYAVWEPRPSGKYKVTYLLRGGTGISEKEVWAAPGEAIFPPYIGISEQGFGLGKEGYILKEWNRIELKTGEAFTLLPSSRRGQSGFLMPSGDVVMEAVWTVHPRGNSGSSIYRNQDVWVHGIRTPQSSDWQGMTYSEQAKTIPYRAGLGWYNVYQGRLSLCWAASDSNILHWWLEQNKDYLERYGYQGPRVFRSYQDSEIFEYFASQWPNRGHWTHLGFEWFISGDPANSKGGFFAEVFRRGELYKYFSERYNDMNKYHFADLFTEAFQKEAAIAVSWGAVVRDSGVEDHAVCVWGAHFDANGFVDKIYYTDSAILGKSLRTHERAGLLVQPIVYDSAGGNVLQMPGIDLQIYELTYFMLGKEQWEAYFKAHP